MEVWDVASTRVQVSIFLVSHLHAKYYRADSTCLIGSANLTGRALGWVLPSNIELLLQETIAHPLLTDFETRLRKSARRADSSLVEEMRALVANMPTFEVPPAASESVIAAADIAPNKTGWWIPSLRNPQTLFQVYCGNTDALTTTALSAARSDLFYLSPPPGLEENAFRATIAAMLLQTPVMRELDPFLHEARRFGAVTERLKLVCRELGPYDDWSYRWQTLMRWLLHFLPERYERRVPRHSELFRRLR